MTQSKQMGSSYSSLPQGNETRNKNETRSDRLWNLNGAAFILHGLQAIATLVLAIAKPKTIHILVDFPNGPPGTFTMNSTALEVQPMYMSSVFFALATLHHFFIVTQWHESWAPRLWNSYLDMIKHEQRNKWRWVEYSLSSTIMVLQISMLTGVLHLSALIANAGCNVAMIMFGDLGGRVSDPSTKVITFIYGSMIGLVPWISIFTTYGLTASTFGGSGVPVMVHVIIFSIFSLFFCFAIVEFCVLTKRTCLKKTSDILFHVSSEIAGAEFYYSILSMTAKTVLGWQVFGALSNVP
jgi:hypothetical protein